MSANQATNRSPSTHKMTEEGSEELKNFGKKLIFLWILQNILIQMIDNEVFPNSEWIPFLVGIMVWVYIALTILRWVNDETTFFEEAEWYKEKRAKFSNRPNDYELTEEGKEIIKNLIRRALYVILLFYLVNKLISTEVIDFDLGIFGMILPIFIFFLIFDIFQKREKLAIKKPGSIQLPQQEYIQSPEINQPVDIFASNNNIHKSNRVTREASSRPISNDYSDSMFSSREKQQSCKKCYGGLNDQGKCNQCDQKW